MNAASILRHSRGHRALAKVNATKVRSSYRNRVLAELPYTEQRQPYELSPLLVACHKILAVGGSEPKSTLSVVGHCWELQFTLPGNVDPLTFYSPLTVLKVERA